MHAKLHFALPDFGANFPRFTTLNFCSTSLIIRYTVYYQYFVR
jgi:hypothetical protein